MEKVSTQQTLTLKQNLVALSSGLLFGLGLGLSQMIDRERILGFLDITGNWDPALLFVLGGAVGVTVIAFRFVLRLPSPIFATAFRLPTYKEVDLPLVLGAAIFGIGWGIAGYCPGPAIVALILKSWSPMIFLAAFVAGSFTSQLINRK
ncbi:putative transporter component [Leptolyngbya sp. PCC 7375]|nr:putative transporter component [Leptolyngbya sp. PCC 7375]